MKATFFCMKTQNLMLLMMFKTGVTFFVTGPSSTLCLKANSKIVQKMFLRLEINFIKFHTEELVVWINVVNCANS